MRLIAILALALALALAFGCEQEAKKAETKSDCRMAAETYCKDNMKDYDGVVEESTRWKRCVELKVSQCEAPSVD
jgi:hypothetical protein